MEHIMGFNVGLAVFREDDQDVTSKQIEEFNDKLIELLESMGMEMGGELRPICSYCDEPICSYCDEEENPKWRKSCPAWQRWIKESND